MNSNRPLKKSSYHCNDCGKTVTRESEQRWMNSYCLTTGRTTRIWKVSK